MIIAILRPAGKRAGRDSLPWFSRGLGDCTHTDIVRGMVEIIGKLGEGFLWSVFNRLHVAEGYGGLDRKVL